MGIVNNRVIDLTSPKVRNGVMPSIEEDIVLIGVPVSATEIPII